MFKPANQLFDNQKNYEQALKMICKVMQIASEQIRSFTVLYAGRLSVVYRFSLKKPSDKFYLIRINGIKKITKNWSNEAAYINASNQQNTYLYFDDRTGNYLKEEIAGSMPYGHENDLVFWKQLVLELIELQTTKLMNSNTIHRSNYLVYSSNVNLDLIDQKLFNKINAKQKTLETVLVHGGLDFKNIIYDSENVHLIDFEWISWGSAYFDLSGLFVRENLSYSMMQAILDIYNKHSTIQLTWKMMQKFLYFTATLSYQWAGYFMDDNNASLKKYQNEMQAAMQQYKSDFGLIQWLDNE